MEKKSTEMHFEAKQRLTLREEILSKATSVKEPFLLMFQARPEPLEKSWWKINPERGVKLMS